MPTEPQMNRPPVLIPEKLFFKIGEVCDIVGIQAHVLRYWESEFPMLAPQKNRAGQRTYRKRDVEMVLRIKELLYDEMYTIPGARKRLASDMRGASKLKVVTPEMTGAAVAASNTPPASTVTTSPGASSPAPVTETLAAGELPSQPPALASHDTMETQTSLNAEQRRALAQLQRGLQDVLTVLDGSHG